MPSLGGVSNHHPSTNQKTNEPKSREVSSRFLSPSPTTTTCSSNEYGKIPSPNISPLINQKPRSSTYSRKHKKHESTGFLLALWPSSSNLSPSSKPDTLANHLGYDRLKDIAEKSDQNPVFLNRQRSCTDSNHNDKKLTAKENHKPVYGGSMRYTGKFKFPGKASNRSSDHQSDDHILPGKFSIDENALRKKSLYGKLGTPYSDTNDSESERSDMCSGSSFDTPVSGRSSPASYMAPTVSSRKQGIEVASKYMHDLTILRSRRWSADSGINQKVPFSPDNNISSPNKLIALKKKANSKWGLSPTSNPKPPTSPSRGKGGVGNILSMGIEFLKGNKKYYSNSSSSSSSWTSQNIIGGESVHQLRLLHNGLMQWRYCNARADAVNRNIIKRAESNFLCAWSGLIKLQQFVVQKKLQLQKEKLEMKMNYMLQSQIKALEIWGSMKRQHVSAISVTKDYLHSVVCKVPLLDGAKVEPQSASIVVRHASDLAASINSIISTFSPMVEESVGVLVELATVVTQEKMLLEECLELFRIISALEVQERSLKSTIMQLKHHH